jgi:hypothetical protein
LQGPYDFGTEVLELTLVDFAVLERGFGHDEGERDQRRARHYLFGQLGACPQRVPTKLLLMALAMPG